MCRTRIRATVEFVRGGNRESANEGRFTDRVYANNNTGRPWKRAERYSSRVQSSPVQSTRKGYRRTRIGAVEARTSRLGRSLDDSPDNGDECGHNSSSLCNACIPKRRSRLLARYGAPDPWLFDTLDVIFLSFSCFSFGTLYAINRHTVAIGTIASPFNERGNRSEAGKGRAAETRAPSIGSVLGARRTTTKTTKTRKTTTYAIRAHVHRST